MKRYFIIFLGFVLILGVLLPVSSVVQAANSPEKYLADDPAPDGQGGIPTPTPIRARMNGTAKAYYTAIAPTINGDWSDWSAPEVPARFVVVGGQHRTNNADIDASYKLAWDEYYLYVAVKMRDDKYVQNARVDQIYKGDSVEILMDSLLFEDFDNTTLNNDDYQVVISPGHGSPLGPKESYVYYPANQAGPRDDIDIATIRGPGVTRVEIAIPWTTFNVEPQAGARFGFAIGISDNDDPVRDLQQTFLSNIRKRSLANPATWGDLTLLD